jgi:hypothetical protein
MATVTPLITTGNAPVITVQTSGLSISNPTITYAQFLNSMGTYNYGAEFFYFYANSFQQITQPLFYNHFDSNGNQISTSLIMTVDPYQNLSGKYLDLNPEETVFDGFASVTFSLLAQSTVFFKMFAAIINNAQGLNQYGLSNRADILSELDIDFNDGYCNYLID